MSNKHSRAFSFGISIVTFSLVAVVAIMVLSSMKTTALAAETSKKGENCGKPEFTYRCSQMGTPVACNAKGKTKDGSSSWKECIKSACDKQIPGGVKDPALACYDAGTGAPCEIYCVNSLTTVNGQITGRCCNPVVEKDGHTKLDDKIIKPKSPSEAQKLPTKPGDPTKTPPTGGQQPPSGSQSPPSGGSPGGGSPGGGSPDLKSLMDLFKPKDQSGGQPTSQQGLQQECIQGSIIPRPGCPTSPFSTYIPPITTTTPTVTTSTDETTKKPKVTVLIGKIKQVFTGSDNDSDIGATQVSVTPITQPGVTGFGATNPTLTEDRTFLTGLIGALTTVRDTVQRWVGL